MTDSQAIPSHVGFILDGNRRWASSKGLPNLEGHRIGYGNLKTIGKHAIKRGVQYVTAFVFSTENWNRSKEEVSYLMDLALGLASHELEEIHKENIRVRFLGRADNVSAKMLQAIQKAETKTKDNTKGTLGLCFNYGGQQEIVDAAQELFGQSKGAGDITLQSLAAHLYAPDIPPVDLIIRTSGEQRISNFMLWRAAYAELYFTAKHWPEFTSEDFDEALAEYSRRHRRFGK